MRGFLHLLQNRRNRAAARELPPSRVLELSPDRHEVERHLADARREARLELTGVESMALLVAYGLRACPGASVGHRIVVHEDPTFGPAISLVAATGGAEPAFGLPPLNLVLARVLVGRAHVDADPEALADILVAVSQLVVDCPELAELRIDLAPGGVVACRARLRRPDAPGRKLGIPPYPAELAETRDFAGESMTIRPIRPEDAEAHRAFFTRLSPEDIRFRFFSAMRELAPEQMARMTQIDYDREMAFIVHREQPPQTVAVARLVRDGEGAEFAIVVQPDMKGRGVASALMRRLIEWGRSQAIPEIVGQVLADNAPMLAFMRHLGFSIGRIPGESDVVEARMKLA